LIAEIDEQEELIAAMNQGETYSADEERTGMPDLKE
jgi:hypothetical protein